MTGGSPSTAGVSTALMTDRYELTMVAAALADGSAQRRCVFELFARRLPDGRRYGVVAGTGAAAGVDRTVPVRRRRSWRRWPTFLDRATLRLAARLPLLRRRRRLPGGRAVLPRLAGPHRHRHVRRRGAAGDAGPVDPQPRQRGGLRGGPDGHRGGRPAAHRDGLAGAPTRRPRWPRPGPPTWPASPPPPTWRPSAGTASRPPAPPRTPGSCCTTTSWPRSPARSRRSARRRRCWSTPTTCSAAWSWPCRRPGPGWARSGSTPATSACWPGRPARSWTRSARRNTRIVLSGDLDEYAIAALRAEPVDSYGVGTSVVTGSGAPTAGMVYKLVEVDGRPVAKRSAAKESRGGRKSAVRRYKPTGTAIEEVVHDADRPAGARPRRPGAADPADARRRAGGRACRPWSSPASTCAPRWCRCPGRGSSSPAASRPSRPCSRGPDDAGADRGGRAERLLRGRVAAVTGGAAVAAAISARLRAAAGRWDHVVATRDHHVDPGAHFSDHPGLRGLLAAALPHRHPGRLLPPGAGRRPDRGGVRQGRRTGRLLRLRGHRRPTGPALRGLAGRARGDRGATWSGIATDHCVRATALDAAAAGLRHDGAAGPVRGRGPGEHRAGARPRCGRPGSRSDPVSAQPLTQSLNDPIVLPFNGCVLGGAG